jgi:hypothetical protein
MTLAQFAIGRVVGQLTREAGRRELSAAEWRLLHKLSPAVARYEARETGAVKSPALSTGEGRSTANIPGGIG